MTHTYTVYDTQDGATRRSGLTLAEARDQHEDWSGDEYSGRDRYWIVSDADGAYLLAGGEATARLGSDGVMRITAWHGFPAEEGRADAK